jgi:hypothetical protein
LQEVPHEESTLPIEPKEAIRVEQAKVSEEEEGNEADEESEMSTYEMNSALNYSDSSETYQQTGSSKDAYTEVNPEDTRPVEPPPVVQQPLFPTP